VSLVINQSLVDRSSLGDSTTDLFLVIHQMLLVIVCFVNYLPSPPQLTCLTASTTINTSWRTVLWL